MLTANCLDVRKHALGDIDEGECRIAFFSQCCLPRHFGISGRKFLPRRAPAVRGMPSNGSPNCSPNGSPNCSPNCSPNRGSQRRIETPMVKRLPASKHELVQPRTAIKFSLKPLFLSVECSAEYFDHTESDWQIRYRPRIDALGLTHSF